MQGFQLTQIDEALVASLETVQGLRGTLRITPDGLVFVASQSHTSYLLAKRITRKPKAEVQADARTVEGLRQILDRNTDALSVPLGPLSHLSDMRSRDRQALTTEPPDAH